MCQTRQALLIMGMHRSGTSALAGSLNQLGIPMGVPLLPGHNDNIMGFWEYKPVLLLHNKLLLHLKSSWDDPRPLPSKWWLNKCVEPFLDEIVTIIQLNYTDNSLWALKDPRMCRLLPIWLQALKKFQVQPLFLCIFRNPLEVASSLKARNKLTNEQSTLLWLQHNLCILEYTTSQKLQFISYNQLLNSRTSILKDFLLHWSINFSCFKASAHKSNSFINETQRHHNINDGNLTNDSILSNLVYRLHNYLIILSASSRQPKLDEWQEIKDRYLDYIGKLGH